MSDRDDDQDQHTVLGHDEYMIWFWCEFELKQVHRKLKRLKPICGTRLQCLPTESPRLFFSFRYNVLENTWAYKNKTRTISVSIPPDRRNNRNRHQPPAVLEVMTLDGENYPTMDFAMIFRPTDTLSIRKYIDQIVHGKS